MIKLVKIIQNMNNVLEIIKSGISFSKNKKNYESFEIKDKLKY